MESTSARDLDRRLADLVRSERHLVVQFVVELAGFAKRELHRELGYTSLFYYCVRQLGLSKSSAFRRSEVAQLIVRFPAIADRLATGRLSIRALVELREVLTGDNQAGVLARAEGMSQEQAQLLAVEYRPRHIPRDVVRALPRPQGVVPAETNRPERVVPAETNRPERVVPAETNRPERVVPAETKLPARPGDLLPWPDGAVPAETTPPPEVVTPLTPGLRRLNVTVSADFIAELGQVRDALSHQCPHGEFEQVVREAFKLVLERDRKRKGLTERPRPQPARRTAATGATFAKASAPADAATSVASTSLDLGNPKASGGRDRYVPAAVRRAVWQRDLGRCTWPMADGRACGSTHRIEFDHHLEVALGGKSTIGNVRLLCQGHNLLKAEQNLGRALMASARGASHARRGSS